MLKKNKETTVEFCLLAEKLVRWIGRNDNVRGMDNDDLFGDVRLIALRSLEQLENPNAVVGWLHTVTVREIHRMRSKRKKFTDLSEDLPCQKTETQFSRVERQETIKLFYSAVKMLTPFDKEFVNLLLTDTSYDEIAARLDIPKGSIGPTRARIFKKIGKILVDAGFDPLTDLT